MIDSYRSDTELIRRRISLLIMRQVVGAHVKLNRQGRGPCPFHGGKDNNLSVYQGSDSAAYHCFVCGASGDAFSFLQEMTGDSFNVVRRQLAGMVGVTLTESSSRRSSSARGIGPGLEALWYGYAISPLPEAAPAWTIQGSALGLVGYAEGKNEHLRAVADATGNATDDMIEHGLLAVDGVDPRCGHYVVVHKDREGNVVGLVGVDAGGNPIPGTEAFLWEPTTAVGWAAARQGLASHGWVVVAQTLDRYIAAFMKAREANLPLVVAGPDSSSLWSELRNSGVRQVILYDEQPSDASWRWIYAASEEMLLAGLRATVATSLPSLSDELPLAVVRRQLDEWAEVAEDIYGRKIGMVLRSKGYKREGVRFAMNKLGSSLVAALNGPDPLLFEAYAMWTARALDGLSYGRLCGYVYQQNTSLAKG